MRHSFFITPEQQAQSILSRGHKQWLPDEVSQLRQLSRDYSLSEIATLLGRSYDSVKGCCKKYSITCQVRGRKYWSKEDERYLKNHLGVKSIREISQFLGRSESSVQNHVSFLGLTNSYRPCRKTIHSSDDVELCRALHDEGLSIEEISRKMEIPSTTVNTYVNYKCRHAVTIRH